MTRLARTDDRRGDARLMQNPGQRNLRIVQSALPGKFADAINNRKVFGAVILFPRELVRLGANCVTVILLPAIPYHKSARQRAEWRHSDPFCAAQRMHLTFFLSIDDVVVVLYVS